MKVLFSIFKATLLTAAKVLTTKVLSSVSDDYIQLYVIVC